MLDYELCKQLKNVGFPNTETYLCCKDCGALEKRYKNLEEYWSANNTTGGEYTGCQNCGWNGPVQVDVREDITLSELIEACGDKFESLTQFYIASPERLTTYWFAKLDNIEQRGTTPEEAVARLWLALNEKK